MFVIILIYPLCHGPILIYRPEINCHLAEYVDKYYFLPPQVVQFPPVVLVGSRTKSNLKYLLKGVSYLNMQHLSMYLVTWDISKLLVLV